MTEEEWLACEDPTPMLDYLRGPSTTVTDDFFGPHAPIEKYFEQRTSDRKLRLYAVACCRRISFLIKHPASIHAIEVAERFADGKATPDELRKAARAADKRFAETCVYGTSTGDQAARTAVAASEEDADSIIHLHGLSFRMFGPIDHAANASLLRDIIPFHPITLDPSWLTSTVTALAQGMYDSRDFSAMPILADALQDADCDNESILQHCRGPGPHCRGCWCVDLLLNKS